MFCIYKIVFVNKSLESSHFEGEKYVGRNITGIHGKGVKRIEVIQDRVLKLHWDGLKKVPNTQAV